MGFPSYLLHVALLGARAAGSLHFSEYMRGIDFKIDKKELPYITRQLSAGREVWGLAYKYDIHPRFFAQAYIDAILPNTTNPLFADVFQEIKKREPDCIPQHLRKSARNLIEYASMTPKKRTIVYFD